ERSRGANHGISSQWELLSRKRTKCRLSCSRVARLDRRVEMSETREIAGSQSLEPCDATERRTYTVTPAAPRCPSANTVSARSRGRDTCYRPMRLVLEPP